MRSPGIFRYRASHLGFHHSLPRFPSPHPTGRCFFPDHRGQYRFDTWHRARYGAVIDDFDFIKIEIGIGVASQVFLDNLL